jgi:hypothetical protein
MNARIGGEAIASEPEVLMLVGDDQGAGSSKTMQLRRAGRCRTCGIDLDAGMTAVYDTVAKNVSCLTCFGGEASVSGLLPPEVSRAEVIAGSAGASAQREHDRRSDKREARIREQHPVIGGFLLAVSDDPQSTKAWGTGARGEERVGGVLDGLVSSTVRVLHDRRIPPTKANIDHMVVCPTGVFVIDAKKYTGRPSLRVEGGLFRARTETLMVGSRQHNDLVAGVQKQVARVEASLTQAGFADIPVRGSLCFVDADWPLLGGDFDIDSVSVLWPKRVAKYITRPGSIDADRVAQIYECLGVAFPSA